MLALFVADGSMEEVREAAESKLQMELPIELIEK
jgi:hypothetical protein